MQEVIVKKCEPDQLEKKLTELLDDAKARGWFKNLKNWVVIKPNLCDLSSWDLGATTDVELIRQLIFYLKKLKPNLQFTIIESDGRERRIEEAFQRLGYRDGLKDLAELVNISTLAMVSVQMPTFPHEMQLPEMFFEDFFFISVACLKTHTYEKLSCALKNQYGCVADEQRRKWHPYLEEMLDFINQVVPPDLCLVDGRIGMEGAGPIGGTPVKSEVLILGQDPYDTDVVCAEIMGHNPRGMPLLRYIAKKHGRTLERVPQQGFHFRFALIPSHLYCFMRWKIRITRFSDKVEVWMKRGLTWVYKSLIRALRRPYRIFFPKKAREQA